MKEFFFVFPDLSQTKIKAIERLINEGFELNILVSYPILNSKPKFLTDLKSAKERELIRKIMLDSGAYQILNGSLSIQTFSKWISNYIQFVNTHKEIFDYVISPDIPCDNRVKSKSLNLSNLERIKLTISYAEEFLSKVEHHSPITVIQGYLKEEYLSCYYEMKDRGLITNITGVGSMCLRKYSKKEIADVPIIIKALASKGLRLHVFGLNLRLIKLVAPWIYSADTGAWIYEIKYRRRTKYKADDPVSANYAAFKAYLTKLQKLLR